MHPSTTHKPVSVSSQCLAIVLQKDIQSHNTLQRSPSGSKIFSSLIKENSDPSWNRALAQCMEALVFVGYMTPGTLLVSASDLHLECLRGAWARRVLKPPAGYTITSLGNIGGIEMQEVPQTQFIPLPEALCLVIGALNQSGKPATLYTIKAQLQREYQGMAIPRQEVLYGTLQALSSDGRLYCTGEHYFVAVPSMMMYAHASANNNIYASNNNNINNLNNNNVYASFPATWNDAAPYYMGVGPAKQPSSPVQCTVECQTGASIVNAPAVSHKPPAGTSKTTTTSTSTDTAEDRQSRQTKPKSGGFFARLFNKKPSTSKERRSTSGVRKSQTVDSNLQTPADVNVAQNHQNQMSGHPMPSSKPASHSNPSSQSTTPRMPYQAEVAQPQVELGTFSAQFPPSEWLHDPRFLQIPEMSQEVMGKQRKKKDVEKRSKEHRRTTQISQQRYCMFPENLVGSPSQHASSRHRNRDQHIAHRFSKYLSSSSECLQYLGPVDPPSLLPGYAELEGIMYSDHRQSRQHRRRRHKQGKQGRHDNQHTPTQKRMVHPTARRSQSQESEDDVDRTPVVRHHHQHLGINQMESSYLDSTLDAAGGARTSTPTDGGQGDVEDMLIVGQSTLHAPPTHDELDTSHDRLQVTTLRPESCGVDSALSTSPVELSGEGQHHQPGTSGSDKYSSWSGSETKHNNTHNDNQHADLEQSHVYMNVIKPSSANDQQVPSTNVNKVLPNGRVDRTYENLHQSFAGLSTTQFENITDMPSLDVLDGTKTMLRHLEEEEDEVDEGLDTSIGHNDVHRIKRLSPTYISAV